MSLSKEYQSFCFAVQEDEQKNKYFIGDVKLSFINSSTSNFESDCFTTNKLCFKQYNEIYTEVSSGYINLGKSNEEATKAHMIQGKSTTNFTYEQCKTPMLKNKKLKIHKKAYWILFVYCNNKATDVSLNLDGSTVELIKGHSTNIVHVTHIPPKIRVSKSRFNLSKT